jgi:hypothetical protein
MGGENILIFFFLGSCSVAPMPMTPEYYTAQTDASKNNTIQHKNKTRALSKPTLIIY